MSACQHVSIMLTWVMEILDWEKAALLLLVCAL